MIEIITLVHLEKHLLVPVHTEKPTNPPNRYVLIDKTGSSKNNHLPSATIAFQSYAESKYEAARLNEEVKEAVERMIELDEIRGVTINTDYYFPDISTKKYRYQAVYEIGYY